MGKLNSITVYLKSKNHFSIYLSIFRIVVAILIFIKVYHLWRSQSILLSNQGFYEHSPSILTFLGLNTEFFLSNSKYFLLFIILTLVLLIFGIGRKFTFIILYVEMVIIQSFTNPVLNGGDNLLVFTLLYLIFANSFDYLVLHKNKLKSSEISNLISNLAVYSILIHLSYVYFISGIHKIHSDVWFNGTAIYYILHLERFQSPLCDYIMNNGYITTISTYITVLFEIFFCVMIWQKSFRKIFIILGISLHLGILLFMMLYDFQIFFISIYGFFITNSEWIKILNIKCSKNNTKYA